MAKGQKVDYHQLETGYEFPPVSYRLDSAVVSTYLKAIKETSELYHNTGLVPPMAMATCAMRALLEGLTIPDGAIHVSQELEFMDMARVGDTIVCHARISRKQDRGRFHLLSIDLSVFNQAQQQVLAGRTGFVLPEQDKGGEL